MNKNYKIVIWFVIVAVVAIGFWLNVDRWLNHSGALTYSNWNLLSLVFLILLISSLGVGLVLFRDIGIATAMLIIVYLPQLVLFGFSYIGILGIVIGILLGLDSQKRIMTEIVHRIKFRTWHIIGNGIKPFVIGLLIMISFTAYESKALESIKTMDRVPSIGLTFGKELANKIIGNEYNLSEQQKQDVIKQALKDANNQINNLVSPYLEYAPPVLAFLLFLILFGLSGILLGMSLVVAVALVAILRLTNFIRVEEYDVKAERMVL